MVFYDAEGTDSSSPTISVIAEGLVTRPAIANPIILISLFPIVESVYLALSRSSWKSRNKSQTGAHCSDNRSPRCQRKAV